MKKEKVFRILICIAALCPVVWRVSFALTKHTDNIPSLEKMDEGRLRKLAGYRRGQLVTCWGEPDVAASETQDIWDCGEEFSLLVTYRENGKVKEAALVRR